MYDQIRGKGWTYHVSMSSSITEGRIKLTFSRSSSLANAFKAFRDIIEGYYTDGANATAWDPVLLDSAKGALVYSWTETQDSPEDVSSSSVVALLRGAADPFYVPRFVRPHTQPHSEDKITGQPLQICQEAVSSDCRRGASCGQQVLASFRGC